MRQERRIVSTGPAIISLVVKESLAENLRVSHMEFWKKNILGKEGSKGKRLLPGITPTLFQV
jgi:hypothetical protein